MCVNDVCVCDKIDWMENGWMDWIEWMWKVDGVDVEGGAVPDLTHTSLKSDRNRLKRGQISKKSGSVQYRARIN